MAKIFEKIISHRLKQYLETTHQMNPQQYGFRSNRCTEDIIQQTIKYIDTYCKLNKKTTTVSLDVEKVFDKVWHQGLTFKIHNHYNLPLITKKLLSNFILERTYTLLSSIRTQNPLTFNQMLEFCRDHPYRPHYSPYTSMSHQHLKTTKH